MLITLFATLVAAQGAPTHEHRYRSYDITSAAKRGCTVERVSGPPGKLEQPPLIRCRVPAGAEAADRAKMPRKG